MTERDEGGGSTVKVRGFFLGQFRDCLNKWEIGEAEAKGMLSAVSRAVGRVRAGNDKVVITHDGFTLAVTHALEDGRKAKFWVLFESDDLDQRVVVRMIEARISAAPMEAP